MIDGTTCHSDDYGISPEKPSAFDDIHIATVPRGERCETARLAKPSGRDAAGVSVGSLRELGHQHFRAESSPALFSMTFSALATSRLPTTY